MLWVLGYLAMGVFTLFVFGVLSEALNLRGPRSNDEDFMLLVVLMWWFFLSMLLLGLCALGLHLVWRTGQTLGTRLTRGTDT